MLTRSIELLGPHLQELRKRLIKIFLAIIVCTGIAYSLSEHITRLFMAPLFQASPLISKLVYTNLPEAFIAYMKLALLVGIVASFPVILYQVWMFIVPGLKSNEKKITTLVVFWATLLFAAGAAFAFFAVLPRMLHFFMSYATQNLIPLPRFEGYLTFVARTMLTFGLSFEIPFLMVMAGKAGFIQAGYFRKKRFSFYAAIVVLAFLLTAGDFMATAMLAIPLFGLYEAGIFLTALFGVGTK
ncbi:MAG: twin-arginine translocase subunit TatC [Deltaproteobacteria bacterium]|nr:twin-arginine translocase subunit TatC [Deltaproteobacteria bacterium]